MDASLRAEIYDGFYSYFFGGSSVKESAMSLEYMVVAWCDILLMAWNMAQEIPQGCRNNEQ
jgi:hypothetical protein